MTITIPDVVIIVAIVGFAGTQALLLWRVRVLEQKIEGNGLAKKITDLEKHCATTHALDQYRVPPQQTIPVTAHENG